MEASSPGARMIEWWWQHETRIGIGRGSSAEYRQHAVLFNKLLKRVDGDELFARKVIDAFFADKSPELKAYGWAVGLLQKRMLGFIAAVRREEASREAEAARLAALRAEQRIAPPEQVKDTVAKLTAKWRSG